MTKPGPKPFTEDQIKSAFFKRVIKTESCWLWNGNLKPSGYGCFAVRRVSKNAHRLSFEWANGPIPGGMCVCHKCDNRRCVNPDHLFLATHLENIRDCISKGRFKYLSRDKGGDKNPNCKLGREGARAAKDLLKIGLSNKEVAKRLGVGDSTISMIKRGLRWRDA